MTFHYLWLIWLWIFLSLSVKLTAHENSCNKLSFMSLTSNVCLVNNVYNFQHWPFPSSHLYYTLFPIDTEERNYVRTVKDVIFSKVNPVPLKSQLRLVAFSHDVLTNILNLNPMIADQPDFIYFVGGSFSTPASIPLSHRYGGHQFGHWADQLGDGRAVLLGEYVNNLGERWELQLKGSGKTPYSRRGDGRAVLRSSIREFLCSEAMYYLGIPTSRAAAIVVSDDEVIRDMFYDGHPQIERAAVVLRLAKSWFRIGSLEILQKSGEIDVLKQLVDFIIEKHFTSIDNEDKNKYTSFFWSVTNQTAILIALWQSVGFTHGVCNTDNFSLLSITIDYGPFGYLDEYNPGFVPNTSDDEGRYSYEKQPNVGIFNMEKLKIALFPLLTEKQKYLIDGVLNQYVVIYKTKFMQLFRNKLGFQNDHGEEDERLLAILFKMMEETKSDFTTTFRDLGEISLKNLSAKKISKTFWALKTLKKHKWFDQWAISYVNRFNLEKTSDATRGYRMNKINPKYILRNWMAEQAISKAEQNDFSEVRILHNILTNPFTVQKEAEELKYSSKPPAWSKKLKVSCSS